MGGKKTGMKYLMLRVGACLLSGIMISMVLIGNVGSFSWFTDTAAGSARFSVVSIEDIISSYGVDSEINPTKIQITKAEGLEFDPVLYFSVEGEASDYMRHIGPVRLKKRNEEIRLAVGITVVQYLKLVDSLDDKDTIKGRIRIKYLNEFIDESLDISFTREYLVDEFKRNIEELFSSKNQKGRMGANGSFSDLIIYLGESARWEEVDTEVRLNLTQFQEQVIDIFVPGLRQYISAAEDEVEKLTQRVETLQDRIDSLERQNASLGAEIDALKNQRSTGTAGLGGAGGETLGESGGEGGIGGETLGESGGEDSTGGETGESEGEDSTVGETSSEPGNNGGTGDDSGYDGEINPQAGGGSVDSGTGAGAGDGEPADDNDTLGGAGEGGDSDTTGDASEGVDGGGAGDNDSVAGGNGTSQSGPSGGQDLQQD